MGVKEKLIELFGSVEDSRLQPSKHRHLIEELIEETKFLHDYYPPEKVTNTQRKYHLVGNPLPFCEEGHPFKFYNGMYQSNKGCIEKCASCRVKQQAKVKATLKERYGDVHFNSLPETKEKVKQTSLKKYGVEHYTNSKEIKQKARDTYNKNGSDEIRKQKYKDTMKEKYGVENYFSIPEVKDILKQKYLEKYGVENVSQSEAIKEKKKQKALEKYGVDNVSKSEEVKDQIKKTLMEKYGVESAMHIEEVRQKMSILNRKKGARYNLLESKEFFLENYVDKGVHISELIEKFDLGVSTFCALRYFGMLKLTEPQINSSSHEKWLSQNVSEPHEMNKRGIIGNFELDLWFTQKNLAVEVNGLYWHSTHKNLYTDPKKHYEKWKMCCEKGIKLLQFTDHQIITKPDIVLGMIENALGKSKHIGARECAIKELTREQAQRFFEQNHIHGFIDSSIRLGLFHGEKLVCAMMFRKNGIGYELSRFASVLGFNIVGGAGRLLKHFENVHQPKQIISFSYNDFGTSKVSLYEKLGFVNQGCTIGYWWYDPIRKQPLKNNIKFEDVMDCYVEEYWTYCDSGIVKWVK